MRHRNPNDGRSLATLLVLAAGFSVTPSFGDDDAGRAVGVKVPPGFEVTLYADDKLAHNIYTMTVDAKGRVVVSGPGYVRILLDTDGDGVADSFKQFADGPKTGTQGMYFDGPNLLCIGDRGLIWYRDKNGDDRADGPPELFLKVKTGAEHHAHAIRKGPDGYWYLIAGNHAGVTAKYASMSTSPIKQPEAGTLMRLKPDLTGGEIIAHGYRNAYDFAFNAQGDLFTFDSDGERDVSLPWYRPTRVFHMLPASHAGWFSRSWKRPAKFLDMPPVVGSFGRGSPTGVACYRHRQFPLKYHNAVFVLDWTFGRVLALPLERSGSTWKSKAVSFMTGVGEFGFAPTDVAVGANGSLFVSVGGRGTRGGVYRVRYVGSEKPPEVPDRPARIDLDVWRCLTAPQPLASWSRARWQPLAKRAGAAEFRKAAIDEELPIGLRLRAIEILTEFYLGLSDVELSKLLYAKSPEIRARAIWSHGCTSAGKPNTAILRRYAADLHPQVRRAALEALFGAGKETDFEPLLPTLTKCLVDPDEHVRLAAIHVVERLPKKPLDALLKHAKSRDDRAVLAYSIGWLKQHRSVSPKSMKIALMVLQHKNATKRDKRDAIRQMQIALGDFGPRKNRPPVYDGYAGRADLSKYERALDPARIKLAEVFPTGDEDVDYELARLIAMLEPYNSDLLTAVLKKIDTSTHPVSDLHYLIVASQIANERNFRQRKQLAEAFTRLDEKIRSRKLKQDSNWDPRVMEMYERHARLDPALPLEIVKQPGFGRPGHVLFLSSLPQKHWQVAIDAFVKRIEADPNYEWNTDVVVLLAESNNPAHRDLIRRQFSNFGLRDSILKVLATSTERQDRAKFVRGLQSGQLDVIKACARALGKLPATKSGGERIALFKAARRLGRDKREVALRDELVKLLRRSTGQTFGYKPDADPKQPPSDVMKRWEAWLTKSHPSEVQRLLASGGEDSAAFRAMLEKVDWTSGDAERGKALYRKRSCAQCHGGRRALGPDLAGVARRFSRDDFFTSILRPSRDVSPRYQTTQIVTTEGKTFVGLAVYQSVDGITLRTSQNQTVRIEAEKIEIRRQLNTSVMPAGLLKGLKPRDLADLYAYVRSLSP